MTARSAGSSDRPFLAHVTSAGIANVALPLSSLITGPLLARALDPTGRGNLAMILVPLSLANAIFTLGLPEAVTHFVARRRLTTRRAAAVSALGGAAAGLVAALVLWILAPILLRNYPEGQWAFRLLTLTLPLTLAFGALRGVARGIRRFDLVAQESIVGVSLRLLLLVALLAASLLTPITAAWVSVLAPLVGSLLLLRAVAVRHRAEDPVRLGELSSFAGLTAVGTLGSILILRLDQVLMAPLTAPEQLGYYAVAVSIAELPLALTLAVRDVVTTVAADTDDPSFAALAARRTGLVILPMALVGGALAPWVVPLLFGEDFGPAVPMTQVLLVGSVFSAIASVLGGGLLSAGRPALRSLVLTVTAVATIVLLVLLVPGLGGMGAAWATLLSYLLSLVLTSILFTRVVGTPWLRTWLPDQQDLLVLSGFPRHLLARLWGRLRRDAHR